MSPQAPPAVVLGMAAQKPKTLPFGGLSGPMVTLVYGGKGFGAALALLGAAFLLTAMGKELTEVFKLELEAILSGRRKF